MGDAASVRKATAAEIEAMRQVVRQAMQEGAIGFSTSQLDVHVGEDGRGVPSNHAGAEEIVALCAVLSEFDRGVIEIIPRSIGDGYSEADRALLLDMYRVSGRPIELNLLLPTPQNPLCWERTLDFAHDALRQGARLYPQFSTNELGLHLKLADTFVFDEMDAWREVLTLAEPERSRRLRDTATRARMRREFDDLAKRSVSFTWDVLAVDAVCDPAHADCVGRTVAELAAARGADELDTFLDVSLAEGLQTQWGTRLNDVARAFIDHVVRTSVADPIVMSGSSDGGAHLASFTGADYTTRLLTDWVPDPLSFEQAVWRLTGMPATVHGLLDRGTIRVGAYADLVLLDPTRLAAGHGRLVRDFPADTERFVVDATGYVMTLVNGEVLLEDGVHSGNLPGHVLRGG
jgi:N-acyl-D-amino-acid deacylase